ncbi:LrgB family protein [uncultured Paenibacillus sp.]|uniref:LrgB family protein n=1 Tax=uncultured Paenibacillus sp. TaxID=227322 RepID=UPI0015B06C80|nr:LrgB family protein [uncultured Paenibacillus sp.]
MREIFHEAGIVLGVVLLYLLMSGLYRKLKWAILVPVLTCSALVIGLLLTTGNSYGDFMRGGRWLQYGLGPAVVALAYPMYKELDALLKEWRAVLAGTIVGIAAGMISGIGFALWVGYPRELIMSILPKSITTPVAMEISSSLGGNASITSALVMIAGLTGVILGPIVFKCFGITNDNGQGIGFGAASHALGTGKAAEFGPTVVSTSTVALTFSAVFGSVLAPLVAWLLL